MDIGNKNKALNPREPDDKIIIYQRQVKGWFLEPAKLMLRIMEDQASFAILAICFSYLEGVEQYRRKELSKGKGKGKSREFFKSSFRRVFGASSLDDDKLDILYGQGRCGLFHDGMTRSDAIYDMGLTTAFTVINNNGQNLIHFHPRYLLEGVEKDFDKYINEVKSKQDNALRDNFDKMYKIV